MVGFAHYWHELYLRCGLTSPDERLLLGLLKPGYRTRTSLEEFVKKAWPSSRDMNEQAANGTKSDDLKRKRRRENVAFGHHRPPLDAASDEERPAKKTKKAPAKKDRPLPPQRTLRARPQRGAE